MKKLRYLKTDLPLMKEAEIYSWAEQILKNTNYIDIQILYETIGSALEEHKLAMIHDRINNMCPKCERVYPEHISYCIPCNYDKLRPFKIHHNMHELEKNYQENEKAYSKNLKGFIELT